MTEHHEKAYERIIHRVEESLEKAEEVTLDELKHGIDQAIEFEEDVEELTKQEISLLGAYLKRDLHSLNSFMGKTGKGLADWLKFDLGLLENRLKSVLEKVADKSVLLQPPPDDESAEHNDEVYVSNEYVMSGTFVCINCGSEQEFIKPGFLMSCSECGADQFLRSSHE